MNKLIGIMLVAAMVIVMSCAESKPDDYASLSLKKLTKYAEGEDVRAMEELGDRYEKGVGVGEDLGEAFKWNSRAADRGSAKAQCRLALSYAFGKGVEQDLPRSSVWFQRSAEQGWAYSQYLLGLQYASGTGVERDLEMSYYWLYIAKAKYDYVMSQNAEHNIEVTQALNEISGYLSPAQRSRLEHSARAFLDLHNIPISGGASSGE